MYKYEFFKKVRTQTSFMNNYNSVVYYKLNTWCNCITRSFQRYKYGFTRKKGMNEL